MQPQGLFHPLNSHPQLYGMTPAALRSKLAKVLFPKMITKANKMRDKDAYYTPTAGGMAADQIPVEATKEVDALVRLVSSDALRQRKRRKKGWLIST